MGKITEYTVSYKCDNCEMLGHSATMWYGLKSRNIYGGMEKAIFCSENCAREWLSNQIDVRKLDAPDLEYKFRESVSVPVRMGNTD